VYTVRINRSHWIQILLEFDVAIVLVVGLSVLGIIGYKSLSKYLVHESTKVTNEQKVLAETKILQLVKNLESMENSRDGYRQKFKFLQKNYDLDYDDIDLEDDNPEGEFKLSELAESIYPKLPPSLAKLIDKEEFQNAVIKTVEKSPEILNVFVEKFLGKKGDDGSTSNTTPQLKEVYL